MSKKIKSEVEFYETVKKLEKSFETIQSEDDLKKLNETLSLLKNMEEYKQYQLIESIFGKVK